jgi:hypothetical protein
MDKVQLDLTTQVAQEVKDYNKGGGWLKATGYFVSDAARQIYAVIVVPDYPRDFPAGVVILARIVGDKVVIEQDLTDRPLFKELMRVGIPREQIILTYAGEAPPAEAAL